MTTNRSVRHGTVPLMPDAELLRKIDEMLAQVRVARNGSDDGAGRRRLARQVELISREIRARGIWNPPWWSAKREWEIEDGASGGMATLHR